MALFYETWKGLDKAFPKMDDNEACRLALSGETVAAWGYGYDCPPKTGLYNSTGNFVISVIATRGCGNRGLGVVVPATAKGRRLLKQAIYQKDGLLGLALYVNGAYYMVDLEWFTENWQRLAAVKNSCCRASIEEAIGPFTASVPKMGRVVDAAKTLLSWHIQRLQY